MKKDVGLFWINWAFVDIFNCVLFTGIECFHIYISSVFGVCVAMVTSLLHPHCICSLINAIKSVINHVVLCVQHHYVPSYIKYIVMHRCYGEICVHHWFQALAWKEKLTNLGMRLSFVKIKGFLGWLSKRSPALPWMKFLFFQKCTLSLRELLNKQYSFQHEQNLIHEQSKNHISLVKQA